MLKKKHFCNFYSKKKNDLRKKWFFFILKKYLNEILLTTSGKFVGPYQYAKLSLINPGQNNYT